MPVYAYRGNSSFIDAVEPRLKEAGFDREGEIELADFIITFCTTLTELEDLYFGEDGIVDKMKNGSYAIDLSPSTPNFSNEIHAVVTISDFGMITAPLMVKDMVSPTAFDRDNISCFASGDQDWIDKGKALLDAIFGEVEYLSSPSLVQLARASQTLQKTSEIISAIESKSLFESSRKLISGINSQSVPMKNTSPEVDSILRAISENRFEAPYTVEMLMSELSAAIMAADDNDIIIPQAEAAFHLLELLAIIGGSQKSPAALALVYGNVDEEECKKYGLDWSRAESLYGDEHDHLDAASDGYLDEDLGYSDDIFDDDMAGFGYSSN